MRRIFLTMTTLAGMGLARLQAAATVDFVKDIQPIFQASCVKCHGPDKQKGDLRLDSKAAAFKGGKDGPAIVPGHADKSDLYRRVTLPPGSDDIMPSKGDPLTKAQTDLIRDWINQGALWPDNAIAKAVSEPASAPAISSGLEKLTPFKPSSAELAAIAKFEADGITVRPIAANVTWCEASFRGQGSSATDAAIAPLKDILSLVNLNLAGTKITDAGLQNIAGLTNLMMLHLEHTKITDAGVAHLAKLSNLTYLNLYDTGVTDQGLTQLKALGNLRHLYLWQTKVTAEGVVDLQKTLPQLQINRGWENDPVAIEAKAEAEKAEAEKKAKDAEKKEPAK